ncbi:MAG: TIGR00296 family protein [Candidatus ainarchaeum sp.]|nr:TIGR00296 family protein [Candidatus ainarchaeum sp.]
MLSEKEGAAAVRLARDAIEGYLAGRGKPRPGGLPEPFGEKLGVFVTLRRYPGKELRGCIGFPQPTSPLGNGLVDAAILAATEDPRFPPVRPEEMGGLLVEVSVLTKPEEVKCGKAGERVKEVRVGRDGLIVEYGGSSGLLLPQVPVELGWSEEEFLCETCMKAGLPPDWWLEPKTRLCRFQAQVFSEELPGGDVKEEKLQACRPL